jgi:hypothetical protein
MYGSSQHSSPYQAYNPPVSPAPNKRRLWLPILGGIVILWIIISIIVISTRETKKSPPPRHHDNSEFSSQHESESNQKSGKSPKDPKDIKNGSDPTQNPPPQFPSKILLQQIQNQILLLQNPNLCLKSN